MKRIFWVLAIGAVASAAMAVGLGRAAEPRAHSAAHGSSSGGTRY